MTDPSNMQADVWRFDSPCAERNLLIGWTISWWCNYECSYCFFRSHDINQKIDPVRKRQPRTWLNFLKKRPYAHSFKNYPVEDWLAAIRRIGEGRKISFMITGGEPFLDVKNFRVVLAEMARLDCIHCLRIDTNGSWKASVYKGIDFTKVFFNLSYHPEQTTLEALYDQAHSYQDLGITISQINFIMTREQMNDYEKVRETFRPLGIRVNPNPFVDGHHRRPADEVAQIQKYLDTFDVKYKTLHADPFGRPCRCPQIALQVHPDGSVINMCFPGRKAHFINDSRERIESLLSEHVDRCPVHLCVCTHMYPFLAECGRYNDTLNPIDKYPRTAILDRS